ncbi:cystathionine beta-lyase [Stylonychia lemnae]|uniref:Cystathionine beta-lyase n=1 Tax=Stylonychia lemnae TaxID=5949 RepID=A0A078A598_STYLE|nr:cystathionine beta-lyase [Stylonychia lemnae]|eukprot:CDW75924.1 cystathionine beta-lyase [Stylonychia lemnae]
MYNLDLGNQQLNKELETKVEAQLASLEKAKYCLTTNSGVSSISIVLQLLNHGDCVAVQHDYYNGTRSLINKIMNHRYTNVTLDQIDPYSQLENLLSRPNNDIKLVFLESPSNPMMTIIDFERISQICKKHKVISAADNTICSPIYQNPLTHGIDIVIHSCTKYIGGHSDCVAGAICTKDEDIYKKMRYLRDITGQQTNQFNLYLMDQGLQTLKIRAQRVHKNAIKIAEYLKSHPKVAKVYFPLFDTHAEIDIMKKQSTGYLGLISFHINTDDFDESCEFPKRLKMFEFGPSLGGVISSIEQQGTSHKSQFTPEDAIKRGFKDNLMRISVGIENAADLIADLEQSLSKVKVIKYEPKL